MKVKANENFEMYLINIKELGRPAVKGEIFEIDDSRVDALVNGNNYYNLPLADIYVEKPEEKVNEEKPKEEKPKKAKKVKE